MDTATTTTTATATPTTTMAMNHSRRTTKPLTQVLPQAAWYTPHPTPSLHSPKTNRRITQQSSRHHEHRHAALTLATPGHDLGMLGVILHVVGDAVNNIGVMVVAIAIWKAEGEARFYADPAVSLFIAVMIFLSAFPLVKNSGLILLQSAPLGVDLEDIKHDLEKVRPAL